MCARECECVCSYILGVCACVGMHVCESVSVYVC